MNPTNSVVEVHMVGKDVLLRIPAQDVHHVPRPEPRKDRRNNNKLFLCEKYQASDPQTCKYHGTQDCRFVHADLSHAQKQFIHINNQYTLEDCPYERYDGVQYYTIFMPNAPCNVYMTSSVPANQILKTRCVFDDPSRPPCQCAHFFYSRECHLGPACFFAHVLNLENKPTKSRRQRKKNKMLLAAQNAEVPPPVYAPPPQYQEALRVADYTYHEYYDYNNHYDYGESPPTTNRSTPRDETTTQEAHYQVHPGQFQHPTMPPSPITENSFCGTSIKTQLHSPTTAKRFRHNPYALAPQTEFSCQCPGCLSTSTWECGMVSCEETSDHENV